MTTAIVLAAGSSRRLGRPKQLLTIDGETLVARATRIAREAVGEVLVVVPSRSEGAGWPDGAQLLVNHHADEGVASSIRLGVSQCDGDVLLVLCDQPRITAAHLRALVDAKAPIAATAYAGIIGVPAFFSRTYRNELLALRGDAGARRIIEAHREVVAAIPFEDAAIDIDTEGDARNL